MPAVSPIILAAVSAPQPWRPIRRELKLLVDRREDLVGERARMINRLRWHLHELDPSVDCRRHR